MKESELLNITRKTSLTNNKKVEKEKGLKFESNPLRNQNIKNYNRLIQNNKPNGNFKGLTRLNIG